MTTLADFRTRVRQMLMDSGAAIWPDAALDEALQRALDAYSGAALHLMESVLTLVADGYEIELNGLAGLSQVLDAQWPYDPATPPQQQARNLIASFRLDWDDGQPSLRLSTVGDALPQSGDHLRLWYGRTHTIENLAGATATTPPELDHSTIVVGAAAFAAMTRALDLMEVTGQDLFAVVTLGAWGRSKERQFKELLAGVAARSCDSGVAWAAGIPPGWRMDKWDRP